MGCVGNLRVRIKGSLSSLWGSEDKEFGGRILGRVLYGNNVVRTLWFFFVRGLYDIRLVRIIGVKLIL